MFGNRGILGLDFLFFYLWLLLTFCVDQVLSLSPHFLLFVFVLYIWHQSLIGVLLLMPSLKGPKGSKFDQSKWWPFRLSIHLLMLFAMCLQTQRSKARKEGDLHPLRMVLSLNPLHQMLKTKGGGLSTILISILWRSRRLRFRPQRRVACSLGLLFLT